MEDELQLRMTASAQREAERRRANWTTSWLPQKRGSDAIRRELPAEERLQQLITGYRPDGRPAALTAGPLTTCPPLLQELAHMRTARGCSLTGLPQAAPTVTNGAASLFGIQSLDDPSYCSSGTTTLELDSHSSLPLPYGWEKCLDLQTGSIYYLNRGTGLTTSLDPRTALPASTVAPAPHDIHTKSVPPPASPSSASSDITFEGVPRSSFSADGAGRQRPPAPPIVKTQGEAVGSATSLGSPPSVLPEGGLDLSLSLRPFGGGVSKTQGPDARTYSNPSTAMLPSTSQIPTSRGCADIGNSPATIAGRDSAGLTATLSDASRLYRNNQASDEVLGSARMSSAAVALPTVKSQDQRAGMETSFRSVLHPLLDQSQYLQRQNETAAVFTSSRSSTVREDSGDEGVTPISCMMMGACSSCLMFVMVSRTSFPKCPRCGTPIDVSTPGFIVGSTPPATRAFSDRLSTLSSPPPSKKAKLLQPAFSLESFHSNLEPAVSIV